VRVRETKVEDEFNMVFNLLDQSLDEFTYCSRYVIVKKERNKAMFYWFFEDVEITSQKPLVLWFTRGTLITYMVSIRGQLFQTTNHLARENT
jgi:hypothetical protein